MLRYFGLSSLCLAGLIYTTSVLHGEENALLIAFANGVFKFLLIPWILLYSARRVNARMGLKFYLRPTATYFLTLCVLILSMFIGTMFPELPYLSIALVLLGLMFMIIRKDLYSQIMGFMTMENGIASYGILKIGGFPFVIEMGILFVIITGTVVMAVLSRQVQEIYATGDTDSLTELTE